MTWQHLVRGDRFSIERIPLNPELGVSSFGGCSFLREGRVERHSAVQRNPPITFICELKKQIRRSFVLLGEGQSAISDRAGDAHGISNPKQQNKNFVCATKAARSVP